MVQTSQKPFHQNQIKKKEGNLPSGNTENTKLWHLSHYTSLFEEQLDWLVWKKSNAVTPIGISQVKSLHQWALILC